MARHADPRGRLLVPAEWQRIGNEIEAAFIFARAHFVNVL
jgi:hypothetical protein